VTSILALLLDLSGTIITLQPSPDPAAVAEVVMDNVDLNDSRDNGTYPLSMPGLTVEVEFIWQHDASGDDAVVVLPPDGITCLPVDCTAVVPEGKRGGGDPFRLEGHVSLSLSTLAPISSSLRRGASGGGLSSSLVPAATHARGADRCRWQSPSVRLCTLRREGRVTPGTPSACPSPQVSRRAHLSPGAARVGGAFSRGLVPVATLLPATIA
jgi:hypothetical protein